MTLFFFLCFFTLIVAVGIMDPPEPPMANSNFVSFSTMVAVTDERGRLPGPKIIVLFSTIVY